MVLAKYNSIKMPKNVIFPTVKKFGGEHRDIEMLWGINRHGNYNP